MLLIILLIQIDFMHCQPGIVANSERSTKKIVTENNFKYVDEETVEIISDDFTTAKIAENCVCVIYYLCDDNNYVITNGEGLLEARISDNDNSSTCENDLFVCCRLMKRPNYLSQKPFATVHPLATTTPTLSVDSTIVTSTISTPLQCGVQKLTEFSSRILSPMPSVTIGEFPWMVAIFYTNSSLPGFAFKCGASLIHPQVLLTATHCILGLTANNLKAIVGGVNLANPNAPQTEPYQEREISDIIQHPTYHKGALYNDIALLTLNQAFIINGDVNTICLPLQWQIFDSSECFVAGWGQMYSSDIKSLKKVEVPILEHDDCNDRLRKTRLGVYFALDQSFLCAGGQEGQDSCFGDGGGPLVCPVNNQFVQAGIVSWGIGCGTADVPGVYAKVSLFRNWIDDQLKNKKLL